MLHCFGIQFKNLTKFFQPHFTLQRQIFKDNFPLSFWSIGTNCYRVTTTLLRSTLKIYVFLIVSTAWRMSDIIIWHTCYNTDYAAVFNGLFIQGHNCRDTRQQRYMYRYCI